MGIDVHLEQEDGTRLASVLDAKGIVARLMPIEDQRFPLLQYVDLYGNTIFNRTQAKQILTELDNLMNATRDSDERSYLDRLRQLTEKCEEEPHLYLKFVGD